MLLREARWTRQGWRGTSIDDTSHGAAYTMAVFPEVHHRSIEPQDEQRQDLGATAFSCSS